MGFDTRYIVHALAIDRTNPNIIYVGTESIGVYKSSDGGQSWSAFNDGLQVDPNDANFWGVNALAIDPDNPGIVFAGATFDGVFKSSNGGRWSAFNVGLTNLTTNALAVDPSNPNIVYTGTDGGVFKTISGGASWSAKAGSVFDLKSNAVRPAGWTSADAAGLPIFPGLVRYDEVFEQREIKHALRFTVGHSRQAYVYPARHFAGGSDNPNYPPMGMRVRLKASYDISKHSPPLQVILRALKRYGMFVADNGKGWFLSGAPDPRWNDDELGLLKLVHGRDFEVVKMGTIVTK